MNPNSNKAAFHPVPPLPADMPSIVLSDNSIKILEKRYLRRGNDGQPIESIDEMLWRIAWHVADLPDREEKPLEMAREFYHLLSSKAFFPNSPTFTGAGTPLGQLAACFVLPISDDMGRASDGIFATLRDAALIQQTGGGNGFDFSRLRPKGASVNTSAGEATGPVGFLRVYDHAFGEIAQGGTRRGANMGILRIDHPDVEEFIRCKTSENAITNFNISVAITDAFMQAVESDSDWELRFVDVQDPAYKGFSGSLEQAEDAGLPIRTYKTVSARKLFEALVRQAHHNGEPGILFLDSANRSNPVPHLYHLEATNPCGEQWLGPYENCCLGSLNLSEHFAPEHSVDWEKLRQNVRLAVRFLDHVVDKNAYVPAVPQLRESALNCRRIGLGIMGLSDLMYHVGVSYGSEESVDFCGQVMEFVRYHAMQTSIELAKEQDPFPAIKGSIYDPQAFRWQPPTPLKPYHCDWQRPPLNWESVTRGLLQYGIRNAAQTTIAPTGTIGTVAGCEGYGCEPVFALAYVRRVNDNGKSLFLNYVSPQFQQALNTLETSPESKQGIIEEVLKTGSCQNIEGLPIQLRKIFRVSNDISASEHIRIQASLQRFVDNSISKTINFPEGTTREEVADAFLHAWKLGCKGLTVYITGSREDAVLETQATIEAKDTPDSPATEATQLSFWQDIKQPRPHILTGHTSSVETPLGKAFVTINESPEKQPFEVFINTSKAGSETAAHSEAIGRLISYTLRISSSVEPRLRLKEVMDQMSGIGGSNPLGFGPNRVRSLPDGIAKALREYLFREDEEQQPGRGDEPGQTLPLPDPNPAPRKIGELCPECGQASLINEEGCRKCYTCGHSEC